jgi:uncharacterized protein (DUF1800 family)
MALTPYTNLLNQKTAAHLLRRATLGPNKSDIDAFSGLTAAAAINTLFQTSAEPKPPVLPNGAGWLTQPPATGEDESAQQKYIRCWWLGVLLNTGVSVNERLAFSTREKIVFFLHSHFTTIQETVGSSRALYFQNILFRKFAFDASATDKVTIKELTKKLCIDNAMLVLLDGRLNVKGNPNENFARELLELYTIGKGLSGSIPDTGTPGDYYYFTEQDVQAAAKTLSGYDVDATFSTIDADTLIPRGKIKAGADLVPTQHDNSNKQFSNRMNNAVITPDPALLSSGKATQESMLDELDQLINLIYEQEETAKNICRKLYRFYVYHNITTAIDTSIIAELVTTLKANNYKIEPVIRELLQSQHFFDSADSTVNNDNFGAIIKSPVDLTCGTLSFFECSLPDYIADPVAFYTKTESLLNRLNDQGLNLLNPYDVAGYEAYHQFPVFNRNWINSNSLPQRYKFIYDTLTTEKTSAAAVSVDLLSYMQLRFSSNATDPDWVVRQLASYLLPLFAETIEISTERLNWFKAQFLKLGQTLPQGPVVFWQYSWNNANTDAASEADARGMLQDLLNAMLQSPEFQLH